MMVGGISGLDQRLARVAVVGAAGKMGRGISFLLLLEMAKRALETPNGREKYRLCMIDTNDDALPGLRRYVKTQLLKWAEKNVVYLRDAYKNDPKLISNQEIVTQFVDDAIYLARVNSTLQSASSARLVFEAVGEDPILKEQVYTQLNQICDDQTFFLSNTSSIPISEIASFGALEDRVIGFHFYNPPPVQKLVEIIRPKDVDPELLDLSNELGQALGKTLAYSHDIAGFIGNGHFIRELCFACAKVRELSCEQSLTQSLVIINQITEQYLVRPMGIFQLADYVGIDICSAIAHIMTDHIPAVAFRDELLDLPISHGALGGQYPDGSQKDGFFKYKGHQIDQVLDLEGGGYLPLDPFLSKAEKILGEKPQNLKSWKQLCRSSEKEVHLARYFEHIFADTSEGAECARAFLLKSRQIAQELVSDGIADTEEEVNTVLEKGFYHLYGPCNHYY